MTDGPTLRQPWISDLTIGVHGNVTTMTDRSGDIGCGAEGVYIDDRRLVSRSRLSVDGGDLVPIVAAAQGGVMSGLGVARHLGDSGPDPTVLVRRHRRLAEDAVVEEIVVESRAGQVVEAFLELELGSDAAELHDVKGGRVSAPARPPLHLDATQVVWADARHELAVGLSPQALRIGEVHGVVTASWRLQVEPGASASVTVRYRANRMAASDFDVGPGASRMNFDHVRVWTADDRLQRLTEVSAADLTGLLLTDPLQRSDCFAAAGTPWYLTLFGRDSIWAARLTLPFGTTLAGGTLRSLARRQGRHRDPASAEEPGKILHEVRRTIFADPSSTLSLPPLYYGTVDATALWVCLLHDAWRWGLPEGEVRQLLPSLVAAMSWVAASERAGDGLLRYEDATGVGLSNQGWKDSGDAMRRRDGSIAPAPIALVETMAYAAEAARKAALLVAELEPDLDDGLVEQWTELSDRLAGTIRERFWTSDDAGPYLAMALDGQGRHVDGIGSNMGHVLGTGVLTTEEAARVVDRLTAPTMLRPFGIGTLSTDNPGYNPIGYHTGSVWVHDTAIAAMGMAAEGHAAAAADVLRRLVDLGARVGYRLPELLSGETVMGDPVPYPASCRPQAWAAASGMAVAPLFLGLRGEARSGRLRVAPLDEGLGRVRVSGVRVGEREVVVTTDGAGVAYLDGAPGILLTTDIEPTEPAPVNDPF
ncbi:amylo-alpha-1,6-glucosidase [Nostocoides sp. F2B08]|uniref:glycogen debranching N-terminal domain-containing protein n=1 Tax=Nostocoides sp. F2B08 TaxID=2653936 RepID=UPI001263D015|nr:glycogen debranching N-terminal domain-containing protein [Tetrasphaera sp. F2B08]KAB7742404.1 amylo-alpha-1,6-glucosidase [Tetrasphaera sp. F2B08]